jgi:hypothetical protein
MERGPTPGAGRICVRQFTVSTRVIGREQLLFSDQQQLVLGITGVRDLGIDADAREERLDCCLLDLAVLAGAELELDCRRGGAVRGNQ